MHMKWVKPTRWWRVADWRLETCWQPRGVRGCRQRWKWALREVKKRAKADKLSVLHSRVDPKMNIRDRLHRNEENIDTLEFTVRWSGAERLGSVNG